MTTGRSNYESIMSRGNMEHHDILVVGKSGNGKSAVCNTLLGEERFPTGRSMSATTTKMQFADRSWNGTTIRIIDTPDITNCGLSASKQQAEVAQWKQTIPSISPSLVLVTVRCDVRYTAEEFSILQEIRKLWGHPDLAKTLMIAFTFGDCLDNDICQDLNNAPPELAQLLNLAKRRHLVFTNKDSADRREQAEICFTHLNPKTAKYEQGQSNSTGCCGCCVIL